MISNEDKLNRLKGIGGSDVPIILGISSYKTPYQLYLEKIGALESDFEQTPFQEWGSRIEPLLRIKYAENNRVNILAPKQDKKYSPKHELIDFNLDTIVHPFYDYIRGNLDGYIPQTDMVFEAKCSNGFMAKEWGESGTDSIPLPYLAQVAHYVSCKNAKGAVIAVLIGGYDYREYTYIRDLELESKILQACHDFWDCVERKIEPAAQAVSDLKIKYPESKESISFIDREMERKVSEIREIMATKKVLDEQLEKNKLEVMEYMKESDCLQDKYGNTVVTWKSNKRGSRTFLVKGE